MTTDPYDVAVVRAYRDVFINNKENGLTVLNDILNDLGHYATTVNKEIPESVQLALQIQAKVILDKIGIFRFNNVDGYLSALASAQPRYYEIPEEGDEEEVNA